MSGGAQEGPAPSVEFDLGVLAPGQVVVSHRTCTYGEIVESLYDAEKFRILHICPGPQA